MRISDWSSDVCSSDLDDLEATEGDRCPRAGCHHLGDLGRLVGSAPVGGGREQRQVIGLVLVGEEVVDPPGDGRCAGGAMFGRDDVVVAGLLLERHDPRQEPLPLCPGGRVAQPVCPCHLPQRKTVPTPAFTASLVFPLPAMPKYDLVVT